VRSLYAKYTGALYQVKRASDSATQNIGLLPGGKFLRRHRRNRRLPGTQVSRAGSSMSSGQLIPIRIRNVVPGWQHWCEPAWPGFRRRSVLAVRHASSPCRDVVGSCAHSLAR
jgi:hypothetical protein